MKFNKRKEIKRLQTIIDDLIPFLLSDIIMGQFPVDPPDENHNEKTCPECAWHNRSLLWAEKIKKGELGSEALRLFTETYTRAEQMNKEFAKIAPKQNTPEFENLYQQFQNKWAGDIQ